MIQPKAFIDIHCHLLPNMDDGPDDWQESLAMAKIAVDDGVSAIIATPHQSGNYPANTAVKIRAQLAQFQQLLRLHQINLRVLPGADVRIEPDLPRKILADKILTLADRRRYVLLELPHEVYLPLDRVLAELRAAGMMGILSHPERNRGILNQPDILWKLIREGCLFQVTAGSLLGRFGSHVKKFTEKMINQKMVHFIATDAHGIKSRRPVLSDAFNRVMQIAGSETAIELCCSNNACVISGQPIYSLRRKSA